MSDMPDAKHMLDQYFLEMRWRCLSLAADLDRVERAEGGKSLIESDPRVGTLRKAIGALLETSGNRAERIQLLFSDASPPPNRKSPGDRK
jgi:hypothetical protein